MQCAQCHDHVLYDDYKQAHYYGLYAFFSRSYLFADPQLGPVVGEKADGDVSFKSVFKKKVNHTTGPKLIDGAPVGQPTVAKGQEYWMAPGDKARGIPRFSRRAQLADQLASGQTPEFSRNIANRLWAFMLGRGLVHPLDLMHGDNPPSHPELLETLAREFVGSGYNIKAFLRELALSRTYGRSSEPPPGLSAEDVAPERFAVAPLKPLSPEQLCWALLQATGIVAATRTNVEHQLFVVDPRLGQLVQVDAKRQRLGEEMVEKAVFAQLQGNMGPFIAQFAKAPGQSQDDAEPTVHQALFLANGEPTQSWLGGLAGRVAALADPSALAEELYLSLLTRRPTADERGEVARYLAERGGDRPRAVRELAWAIVTSAEFRFNH
jgi:hypothetical protein